MSTHHVDDIYTLEKPWRDKTAATRLYYVTAVLALAASLFAVLQHAAADLRALAFPHLGKPFYAGFYSPLNIIQWVPDLFRYSQAPAVRHFFLVNGVLVLLAMVVSLVSARVMRKVAMRFAKGAPDTHGSARFLTTAEIAKAGFFGHKGPYLGYVKTRDGDRYIRADLEGHTLVVGPPGVGKTTGYLYLNILSAKGSIFVFDLKGECWTNTAGFRASPQGMNSKCLRLSLSDSTPGNAHLNPMDTIRVGTPMEYQDTLDLVEVIIDPLGKGSRNETMTEGHFQTLASSLLIAAMLYVKYKFRKEKQNLYQVLALFSDPKASDTLQILERMRDDDHDPLGVRGWVDDNGQPTKKNKYIVAPAVDTILMSEEARSSMIATCKRYLKPYRNPLVAEATSKSDFEILDLLDPSKNVSLYLVVAASSKDSLKPVTRLIINMILKKLTERLPKPVDPELRTHVFIDEMPALGELPVLVEGAQYLRGYNVDCSYCVQGYNQIYQLMGQYETLTTACRNVLVFTPGDDDTWRRISERLGDFTIREKLPAQANEKKSSYRDVSRRLLFSNEVSLIPAERAIAFVRGHRPIYLWKSLAHNDTEFKYRMSIPPPFDAAENVKAPLTDDHAADEARAFRVDSVAA